MGELPLKEMLAAVLNAGVTQEEVARQACCEQSTVARIKSGQTTDPRYSLGAVIRTLYSQLNPKNH